MTDVSIKSLIAMAQDYVETRGVDRDNSGTINNDRELNLLLAGTGASTIEDLTAEDIHKKVVERDTEKIFTTFMATENQEQAAKNMEILKSNIKTISDTYDSLLHGFDNVFKLMSSSELLLKELICIFNDNEGNFEQEATDEVVRQLENFCVITAETQRELYEINDIYKQTTGQDFPPIQQKVKFFDVVFVRVQQQIDKIKNGSVSIEQAKQEIEEFIMQIRTALKDAYDLEKQYENQRQNDIHFCKVLLERQMVFASDDSYKADKQDYSRDLLAELIDKTSPMTRNYIIQQAEDAYRPENDPTGISQNNATSNIKRSTYKTQTEIYKLNGNNVIVYDYSGRVLRTEALNPSVHTRFFE